MIGFLLAAIIIIALCGLVSAIIGEPKDKDGDPVRYTMSPERKACVDAYMQDKVLQEAREREERLAAEWRAEQAELERAIKAVRNRIIIP